jgi:gluconate 2-dehydrogenase gamma chain
MNRREALIRVAALMGGTLSASTLLAIRKGLAAGGGFAAGNGVASGNGYVVRDDLAARESDAATPSAATEPSTLSASQRATVSAIVDVMIPRTNTPGALDVGVPRFIDLMLKDVYTEADRDRYLTGLSDFDAAAKSEHGQTFVALEPTQRIALVRKFHDAAVAEEHRQRSAHTHLQRPFILMTKELTLLGFFTSQVGATQVLQYVAVPGSYHGCLPLEQAGNGKTWAVEPGL